MSATENIRPVSIIPQEPAALTPMDMLNRAVQSGAPMEVLEKFMALQERWEANQNRKDFDAAIAAAKAEIKPVVKNRTGNNNKRYADFAAIASSVDPVLSRHGLSYRFRTSQSERISVTCILSHKSGHYEETTLSGPSDGSGSKNPIQAIGSTLTYLQRYSLVQMLGIAATEDDDGHAGIGEIFETVSSEQSLNLIVLCGKVAPDFQDSFCKAYKIANVSQLPAGEYQRALVRINKKIAEVNP